MVLGQFDGYRDVPGIDPHSNQDTFVAATLWIDSDRWRGVPFYLRTGKRLAVSAQRVSLILREPQGPLSGQLPRDANVLCFSLAGDGAIDLSLVAKKPGPALNLDVAHAEHPAGQPARRDPSPAYVRLIHDVLTGDRSLFTRPDGLAAVWEMSPSRCCCRGRRRSAPTHPAHWARRGTRPRRTRSLAPGPVGRGSSRRPAPIPLERLRPCRESEPGYD